MPEAFSNDSGFELLPLDDQDLVGSLDQLAAAEASVADDPFGSLDSAEEPPVPYGQSWLWDAQRERYVRQGAAPVEVRGRDALKQWIYSALRTAQGVHPIFSDEFGIEDPDDWLGVVDPTDALATFQPRALDALVQHDRIEDLDDLTANFDPTTGIISIDDIVVITDEAEAVAVSDIELRPDL